MQVTQNREVTTNVKNSVDFSISTDAAKLFSMLSSALYTDKEKAVCYELGANCYDANPSEPFLIVAPTQLDPVIKFRDYGHGLAEHDVYRLLTVYGASDKSGDNAKIGGYGIGAKSPASVTDSWNVISYHDGKAMEFLVFINDHGIPSLTKIRESATEETGLEVIIPVQPSRFNIWKNCLGEVFKYYPVKPIIKNASVTFRDDSFITAGSNWKMRNDAYLNYGQVTSAFVTTHRGYVPDVSKLEQELKDPALVCLLRMPVVIDFDIGELQLSLSRENIQYTKSTIATIRQKLETVKVELTDQVESVLSKATDGFDFRQKIYEVEKTILGKGALSDRNSSAFLLKIINGRYSINNLNDDIKQFKVVYANTKTLEANSSALKAKVCNGNKSQNLSGASNCFKTHAITIRSDYNNGSDDFFIRFSIPMMENIRIVINDVVSGMSRVKYNFKKLGTNVKFVLLVNKNIFPNELKSYIINASSLDKAPRASRGSTKSASIKSDIYGFRQKSLVKIDFNPNDYNVGKVAYVNIIDARSGLIRESRFEFKRQVLESSGWSVVGIKDGKSAPKDFVSLDNAFKQVFDSINNKSYIDSCLADEFKTTVRNSYDNAKVIFRVFKGIRTTKPSVWNTLQEEYKVATATSPTNNISLLTYSRMAEILNVAPLKFDENYVDKIAQSLYNTYEMFKVIHARYHNVDDAKVIETYLNLVGK